MAKFNLTVLVKLIQGWFFTNADIRILFRKKIVGFAEADSTMRPYY